MERRDFLKLGGLFSLSLFFPWASSREAQADQTTWGGPFFLHMHAAGGWDPTLLCDAKLTAGGTTPVYENTLVTGVQDLNGIVVPTTTAQGKFFLRTQDQPMEDPAHFFTTVGKDVLVFNGVDTQTNNHDTGVQSGACGHNDIELPALAALFAGMAAKDRDVPMAFLAGGQYNRTGDVVGVSRFPGDKVALLAEPYKAQPNDEKGLLTDVAQRRILELRAERMNALKAQATLPRTKRTLSAVEAATRGGSAVNLLKSIASAPPPAIESFTADLSPETVPYLTTGQGNGRARFLDLGAPLETVLRCFQAGVTCSATYAQGGFDTHAQHDVSQTQALGSFLARLRYVLLRAQQMGLRDKLFILVTSDFGRTPRYNTGAGKDHWNVTSSMVIGPGIRGGRAIGKTDEGHKSLAVDRNNPGALSPGGTRIQPAHIHGELRRVLNVESAPFINQFPLPATAGKVALLA